MPKLMGHDACWKAEGVTHLMQVIAELTNQRFFGMGAGQEPSVCRERIEGAKEAQTLHEPANKRIDRDQAFRL